MFIHQCYRKKNGKRHAYWALVESCRTSRGPRQRIVSYLGDTDEKGRLGIRQAAVGFGALYQRRLFDDVAPRWVEIDASRIRVEHCVDFGGPWLAIELLKHLGFESLLKKLFPSGREDIEWSLMAMVLVICRLCNPSSELHIAEHLYGHTILSDLLGIAEEKINDDRLYRALDKLLPHKQALEIHLKEQLGRLFHLEYDILFYDITSTYFEGQANGNPLAQRGYSRDHRPDCKQDCIALVVSKCGMPFGYELFAGNRRDVTTVVEMLVKMEGRYGKADRIWVLDRGMIDEDVIEFLRESGRRYIVGTPRDMLKRFEAQLISKDWDVVREGLEVKLCRSPNGNETFILCRSDERRQKEKAIHERFEKRIEEGLNAIEASCATRKDKVVTIAKRLGRLLGKNSRAAGMFETDVIVAADGRAKLLWKKLEAWRNWAQLTEGCYLLRSNVNNWSPEELWKAYMQLTDAELAFRIHKSDLQIRPVWHQKQERVEAHILVCFLAYVLWKTLGQMCKGVGLGDEPRRVFEEIGRIKAVDVILPTRVGTEIRRRCICRPTDHQGILLHHLGLVLPMNLPVAEKILKTM
jgi:transposase